MRTLATLRSVTSALTLSRVLITTSGNRFARRSHRIYTRSSVSSGDQYTPPRRTSSPLAHHPPIHSASGTYPRALHMAASSCHHRQARYLERISQIVSQLPAWREERLPPPRVSQSQYDKVGLTSMFLFPTYPSYVAHESNSLAMGVGFRAWSSSASDFPLHHRLAVRVSYFRSSAVADLVYSPEIIRMSELNDSSELQTYSSAVLYVLSAVTPPPEFIAVIADNFINAIKSSTVGQTLTISESN